MCIQCLVDSYNTDIFLGVKNRDEFEKDRNGYVIHIAQKENEHIEKGDFLIIRINDPSFVISDKNITEDNEDYSALQEIAIDLVSFSRHPLDWIRLVKAAEKENINVEKQFELEKWLRGKCRQARNIYRESGN